MSKPNKVNKDHYTQRGRLTPDELARERARAIYVSETRRKFSAAAKPEAGRRPAPHRRPVRTEARAKKKSNDLAVAAHAGLDTVRFQICVVDLPAGVLQ